MASGINPFDIFSIGQGIMTDMETNKQNAQAKLGNTILGAVDLSQGAQHYRAMGDTLNKEYGYVGNELGNAQQKVSDLAANRQLTNLSQLRSAYGQNVTGLDANSAALQNNLKNQYSATMNPINELQGDLRNGYAGRQNEVMGLLDGAGKAEQDQIRQNWAASNAKTQQSLTDSGMGGTTIGAQLAGANTQSLNQDLGNAAERLRTQKAGMLSDMSGQALSSQAAMGQYGANTNASLLDNYTSKTAGQAASDWQNKANLSAGMTGDEDSLSRENEALVNDQAAQRMQFGQEYGGLYRNQLGQQENALSAKLNNLQFQYSPTSVGAGTAQALGQASNNWTQRQAAKQAANANSGGFLGMGGDAMSLAGIPLMATNLAAPGVGFATGAVMTASGQMIKGYGR